MCGKKFSGDGVGGGAIGADVETASPGPGERPLPALQRYKYLFALESTPEYNRTGLQHLLVPRR